MILIPEKKNRGHKPQKKLLQKTTQEKDTIPLFILNMSANKKSLYQEKCKMESPAKLHKHSQMLRSNRQRNTQIKHDTYLNKCRT